jgi:hypothetical protein
MNWHLINWLLKINTILSLNLPFHSWGESASVALYVRLHYSVPACECKQFDNTI